MSPLLRSTDQNGLIVGSLKTLASVVATNTQTALSKNGTSYRYGYFMPNPYALQTVTNLVTLCYVISPLFKQHNFTHLYTAKNLALLCILLLYTGQAK